MDPLKDAITVADSAPHRPVVIERVGMEILLVDSLRLSRAVNDARKRGAEVHAEHTPSRALALRMRTYWAVTAFGTGEQLLKLMRTMVAITE